jgi:hypothetical protein
MGLIDQIISVESGGKNVSNPNSSFGLRSSLEVFHPPYIFMKLWIFRIVELLFVSCPTAIAGLVVSVTANAVNRVFRGRLRTHIRKEVLKTRPPTFADFDALCPVVFVTDVFGARASFLHCAPCAVFPRLFHPMSFQGRTRRFFMQATATLRRGRPQMGLPNYGGVPAITNTTISAPAACLAAVCDHFRLDFEVNNKPTYPLAGQIEKHDDISC